jgi:MoxR-like ATPase
MDPHIQELNLRIASESAFLQDIKTQMSRVIVGQEYLLDRLLIALLADGHVLLEGVPGLAKTLAVKTLASTIDTGFQRLQFTPDLLPADLVGTMVYDEREHSFFARKGPIFSNLVLADEINRAPAKVQSALLEAMQERQVTIGGTTFPLPEPFLVLATQNPIEQEGTYPLPEAQIDRFMLKLVIDYPNKGEELQILRRMSTATAPVAKAVCDPDAILRARQATHELYIDEKVELYIVDLVCATRQPQDYGLKDLSPLIEYGASPRATIYLSLAAKAHAFLQGRGYVTPDDVLSIGMDVLRHRVIVSYEAEAEEIDSEEIITRIFKAVEIP